MAVFLFQRHFREKPGEFGPMFFFSLTDAENSMSLRCLVCGEKRSFLDHETFDARLFDVCSLLNEIFLSSATIVDTLDHTCFGWLK